MTKQKTTKKTLLTSVLSLVLCVAMLIGTTFAWFTDSVTSSGNIIKSGNLEVGMYWVEGDLDPTTVTDWNDASQGAIFNSTLWEPGYTEAKHIKIDNEGTLALKYQMRILANGVVSELANVIDVYYFEEATTLTRASLTDAQKLGTLSEVLNNTYEKALTKKIVGNLKAKESDTITLAFHMQESAGNEYQNLSIGTDFSIQLLAAQYTSESDSFDEFYDKNADFAPEEVPSAMVKKLTGEELTVPMQGYGEPLTLDAGYQFEPTETANQGLESKYANAHADFYIYADQDVAANSLMVAGYYDAFCSLINDNWVGLTSPDVIKANQGIRLIADGMNEGNTLTGITVPYSAICEYGNDGVGFRCGVKDDGSNEGTTLTVELRLYETYTREEAIELGYGNTVNKETGNYIIIGIFQYTLGGDYITDEDGAVLFYAEDGDVTLYSAKDVQEAEYKIPDNVTEIDAAAFSGNTATKHVEFPSSITTIGTSAFKGSAIESVVLNEGLTKIDDYAFNQALSLKEFNIPSTVSSIGKNAFRLIATDELVIPATITSISEGAFRDMQNLTKVTIEGSPVIGNFAFRSCPKLTEVYLKGKDVTFTGTAAAFSHGDDGTSAGITVYVENARVAARVYVAQGSPNAYAEKYEIKIGDETVACVKTTDALNTAITNGSKYVCIDKGTYEMSKSANEVTFVGVSEADTKIQYTIQHSGVRQGSIWRKSHFENLTFDNTVFTMAEGGKSTFTDVTFAAGFRRGYGSGVVFTDCTFRTNSEGYALHFESDSSSDGTIQLNACEFNGGKVHLGGGRAYAFTNCNFTAGTDFQVWGNITLENCTVNRVAITDTTISEQFPSLNLSKVTLK